MRVGNGLARCYRLPGAAGTIGFIGLVSEHFCYQCNRLRLTADGRLRLGLLSDAARAKHIAATEMSQA